MNLEEFNKLFEEKKYKIYEWKYWVKKYDELKEYWKLKDIRDLGYKDINRLSYEKNRRWGWVVSGDEFIDVDFEEIIKNRKVNEKKTNLFKWIRKNYLKVIFVGLMFRLLWRISIWILKYDG